MAILYHAWPGHTHVKMLLPNLSFQDFLFHVLPGAKVIWFHSLHLIQKIRFTIQICFDLLLKLSEKGFYPRGILNVSLK